MRQLNSAMNRDSGVQIIVTEVGAADNGEGLMTGECVKIHQPGMTSLAKDNSDPSVMHHQPDLAVLPTTGSRRKLSIVEYSSSFVTSTCHGHEEEFESKMEETTTVAVFEGGEATTAEPTVLMTTTSLRSQVSTLNSTKSLRHKHQTDRTTRMLVAVLVLFLVTEIPQGVMALLSGVLGNQFFTRCYSTGMGEILDLLALLNSAINFLLYCSMSRQFRRAARTQFRRFLGPLVGAENCTGDTSANCFFRPKFLPQPLPVNISPSNPTRCTQL